MIPEPFALTEEQQGWARAELFGLLDAYPTHADALLARLLTGQIDGSLYIDFQTECGCVIGSFAMIEDVSSRKVSERLGVVIMELERAGYVRPTMPIWYWAPTWIEAFLYHVRPGATPDSDPALALVADWIRRWKAGYDVALPAPL